MLVVRGVKPGGFLGYRKLKVARSGRWLEGQTLMELGCNAKLITASGPKQLIPLNVCRRKWVNPRLLSGYHIPATPVSLL